MAKTVELQVGEPEIQYRVPQPDYLIVPVGGGKKVKIAREESGISDDAWDALRERPDVELPPEFGPDYKPEPSTLERFGAGAKELGAKYLLGTLGGELGRAVLAKDFAENPTVQRVVQGAKDEISAQAANLAEAAAPSAMAAMQKREAQEDAAAIPEPAAPIAPEQMLLPPGAAQPGAVGPPAQPAKPKAASGAGGVPSREKELRAAFDLQLKAQEMAAAAEKERIRQQGELQDAQLQEAIAREKRMADLQGAYQRDYEAQLTGLKKSIADFNDTRTTPDPGRWWGSRSTSQKMMAGIGMLFGAFGAPATGGENRAVGVITKLIDDDISAQKFAIQAALDRGRTDIANRQNLLGLMRQKFGDDVQAESAAKLAALERFELQMDQVARRMAPAEAEAKLTAAKGQLQALKAKEAEAFAHRAHERAVQSAELALRMGKLGAPGIPDAAISGNVDANSLSADQRERFIPGLGLALDKEAAKKVREQTGNYGALSADLGRLIEFRRGFGPTGVFNRDQLAAARVLAKRVQLGLKEDGTLGALDKGAQAFLEEMVSDPGRVGFELSKLEGLKSSIDSGYRKKLKPYMATAQSGVGEAFRRR